MALFFAAVELADFLRRSGTEAVAVVVVVGATAISLGGTGREVVKDSGVIGPSVSEDVALEAFSGQTRCRRGRNETAEMRHENP